MSATQTRWGVWCLGDDREAAGWCWDGPDASCGALLFETETAAQAEARRLTLRRHFPIQTYAARIYTGWGVWYLGVEDGEPAGWCWAGSDPSQGTLLFETETKAKVAAECMGASPYYPLVAYLARFYTGSVESSAAPPAAIAVAVARGRIERDLDHVRVRHANELATLESQRRALRDLCPHTTHRWQGALDVCNACGKAIAHRERC